MHIDLITALKIAVILGIILWFALAIKLGEFGWRARDGGFGGDGDGGGHGADCGGGDGGACGGDGGGGH